MQATSFPSLAEHVKTLPAEGARRDRQLHRIIDLYASTEAAAALHAAALRAQNESGIVATALASADTLVAAALSDRGVSVEDGATYDRLRDAVTSPEFLSLVPRWSQELREVASACADTGACTVATAMKLWSWTMKHFLRADSAPAADELAEAIAPLLAARALALEVATNPSNLSPSELELRRDLCHVYAARASAEAGTTCAELVFGYRRHLVWDAEGCATCFAGDDLDELEAIMPGIAAGARTSPDVIEADGTHAAKEGPCARFDGVDSFVRLRNRLDGCLTGARIAKDRAAASIARSITTTLEGKA